MHSYLLKWVKIDSFDMISVSFCAGGSYEFCNEFDMRKPLERSLLIGTKCESLASGAHLGGLLDQCKDFVGKLNRFALSLSQNISATGFISMMFGVRWKEFGITLGILSITNWMPRLDMGT